MTAALIAAPHGGAAVPGAVRGGRLAARRAARARPEGRRLPRARARRRGAAHDLPEHGKADELRVAGRLVGVRFWPRWGPREGIEVVPPRRETPIAPGEPGYTGNPHTDFRIEADAELPVRDDLERRDFTVNAMARDVRSGEWIDPFGGRDDLAAGVLRAVHETAFRDDPLRILRGVARCSIDGLQPDAVTRELMTSGVAAHRRAVGRARSARSSSAYSRATAPWTRCGSRATSARSPWRCPNGRRASAWDQQSATQAYTLDEHILHVLGAAIDDDATRELRLAAFWHDVGKPHARGKIQHAHLGATSRAATSTTRRCWPSSPRAPQRADLAPLAVVEARRPLSPGSAGLPGRRDPRGPADLFEQPGPRLRVSERPLRDRSSARPACIHTAGRRGPALSDRPGEADTEEAAGRRPRQVEPAGF